MAPAKPACRRACSSPAEHSAKQLCCRWVWRTRSARIFTGCGRRDCNSPLALVISGGTDISDSKSGVTVTVSVLPPSPSAFSKASWDDVAPYFDDLAARTLEPSTIEAWLADWSRLEELVTEAAARAMIAYTI